MTDTLADGTFEMVQDDGFDAALEQKLTAANAQEAEPAAAEAPAARQRDEQGKFSKAEAEGASSDSEPEPAAGAETEEPGEPESEEEPDGLRTRIAELEQRLAAKDEFIGRQANEVGELRQLREQMQQLQEWLNRPAEQPYDAREAHALIDENPGYAAVAAYKAGDQATFQRAFEAWREYEPYEAAVWAANTQAEQRFAQLYQHLDQRLSGFETAVAPVRQTAEQTAITQAATAVARNYTDFDEVVGPFFAGDDVKLPAPILQGLSGGQEAKEEALDTLYHYLKGKQAGPLTAAAKQVAVQAADEARQAKISAAVASASKTVPREEPKTPQQAILDEWAAMDAPFANPWSRDE